MYPRIPSPSQISWVGGRRRRELSVSSVEAVLGLPALPQTDRFGSELIRTGKESGSLLPRPLSGEAREWELVCGSVIFSLTAHYLSIFPLLFVHRNDPADPRSQTPYLLVC